MTHCREESKSELAERGECILYTNLNNYMDTFAVVGAAHLLDPMWNSECCRRLFAFVVCIPRIRICIERDSKRFPSLCNPPSRSSPVHHRERATCGTELSRHDRGPLREQRSDQSRSGAAAPNRRRPNIPTTYKHANALLTYAEIRSVCVCVWPCMASRFAMAIQSV